MQCVQLGCTRVAAARASGRWDAGCRDLPLPLSQAGPHLASMPTQANTSLMLSLSFCPHCTCQVPLAACLLPDMPCNLPCDTQPPSHWFKPPQRVFLDLKIDGEPAGRLVIELFDDVKVGSQRFLDLASNVEGVGYRLSKFLGIFDVSAGRCGTVADGGVALWLMLAGGGAGAQKGAAGAVGRGGPWAPRL